MENTGALVVRHEHRREHGLDGAFDECLTNAERILKQL